MSLPERMAGVSGNGHHIESPEEERDKSLSSFLVSKIYEQQEKLIGISENKPK